MSYSRYEQETIINFNEEESTAQVYTFNRSLQTKLRKLSEERPEECQIDPDERRTCGGAAAAYIVPKSWVSVRPPRKSNMTAEERAATAARLKEARQRKT